MAARLPIDEVTGTLVQHLRDGPNLVLLAPPGAGKTTRVPQVLLDRGLLPKGQRVLVLEPRRLAARMAAQRIADERGVRLGGEVGYQVRFEDRTSAETRIALVTEGILTRRLQSDPLLEGVGAVILDEFHERSIHADLALAFLREVQETVRPELKVIVMSATLDPAPVAAYLGGCPVVESHGRAHPVTVRFLERPDERSPVDALVGAVRRAARELEGERGDILAFLPGAGEIRRAKEQLEPALGERFDVAMLYGELEAGAQDRAVRPGPRRKIILSTNIAESSLTIEGVACVVDSGWQKLARFDPALGVDRLELARISTRSAEQRTGRAGRLGPGHAYRCWTEKEHGTMPGEDLPEIGRVDLAPVLLDVLRWSPADPRRFRWFDPPPEAIIERAVRLLRALGAVAAEGWALTPLGEKLAAFPLHPRLAMILVRAHERGVLEKGARIAALASERDVVRHGERREARLVAASDLLERADRLGHFEAEGGRDAGRFGLDNQAARNVLRVESRLLEVARKALGRGPARPRGDEEESLLRVILAGYPDRVGRRKSREDDRVVLVGGGGARLAKESVVQHAELLVALDIDAGRRGQASGLIRLASQVERRWLEEDTPGIRTVRSARWNETREAAEAVIEVRYFDLVLEERPDAKGVPEALSAVLAEAARADLDRALPLTDQTSTFVARYELLRRTMKELELPPLDREARLALLEELCAGKKSFAELRAVNLAAALEQGLSHEARQALSRHAPLSVPVPSGRQASLRYEHDGPPVLSIRLQEVFGMYETPRVANGRVPVKMELLAPNQRPVQVTQDLKSFWETTYAEVRKELRRRYPKHQWPEDPKEGIPSARVRPRR